MPRPMLPMPKEIADIAKSLRAEGFTSISIETAPDGKVTIIVGEDLSQSNVTPLEKWKATRGSA